MAVDVGSIIARLILDRSQFDRELAAAKGEAAAFGDVRVPVEANTAQFNAAASQVMAEKAAMSTGVDIPVRLDPDKTALFSRLVSAGQNAGDVASFLGFNRAELAAAMGQMAAGAAEDARMSLAEAGRDAARSMYLGWLAESALMLGPGGPGGGLYRLLNPLQDSVNGPIPLGSSEPDFTWIRGALGPGAGAPIDVNSYPVPGPSSTTRMVSGDMTAAQYLALAAAGGAAAGGAGGGGGGGGGGGIGAGGLLSALLWGGGSRGVLGLGAGLAGFGSLGSFAGLGPEHLLMTGIGLAGNAVGGMLGGGLLAAGSLATGAVGMGTDLAGIGQAAGDVRNTVQAMNQLNQAVAEYGAGSTQAAQAQAALNYTLASFNPVAQGAVVAAATNIQSFKQMFDFFTGYAEQKGATLISQFTRLGMDFLPTIGQYADQNMAIIQSGLQPLIAWIRTDGLPIFQQMEGMFQAHLPEAMGAFTNGAEVVIKALGFLSQYSGGFINYLDRLFARLNNPQGMIGLESGMTRLIADFERWKGLIEAVIKDVYYLFHADAGTASSIVTSLTQMLDKLGQWEKSTAGQAQMHSIFETHKQEILELLKLLPPLLTSFGHIYLTVAPALTKALTTVLAVGIVPVLNALARNPVGAWVLGLTLITSKIGILVPAMKLLNGAFAFGEATTFLGAVGSFARILGGIVWAQIASGVTRLVGALRAATAAMFGFDAAADANPIGITMLAIAGTAAAAYLLFTHFNQVATFLRGPWGAAVSFAAQAIAPLLAAGLQVIANWDRVRNTFDTVWAGIKAAFTSAWHIIDGDAIQPLEQVPGAVIAAWQGLVGFFERLWNGIVSTVTHAVDAINREISKIKHIGGGLLGSVPVVGPALGFLAGHAAGGPGHAAGGPVSAGQLGWVGEAGPELFVPNVPGTIIPNAQSMQVAASLSGGSTISVKSSPTVVIQGDASEKTVALIHRVLAQHDEQLVQLIAANGKGLRP